MSDDEQTLDQPRFEELRDISELPVHGLDDLVRVMHEFVSAEKAIHELNAKNPDAVKVMAEGALNLAITLTNLIHTWYGLITEEWEVTKKNIDAAFLDMTLFKDSNPFYDLYKPYVAAILLSAEIKWITARIFEKEAKREKEFEIAYICHSGLFDIFPVLVYCFYSSIQTDSPIYTQRKALTKAQEYSIAIRGIVHRVDMKDYVSKRMEKINGD